MTYSDIRIILPTCDKYMHLIEALAYTVEKFWKDHPPITLVGYSKVPTFELPDGWDFFQLPVDRGARYWSNDMINIFNNHFLEEYFIYLEDDILVVDEVDSDMIKYLFELMVKNGFSKVNLGGAHSNEGEDIIVKYPDDKYNIAEVTPRSPYRTCRTTAIWKKDYFLQHMRRGMTPWDFERVHPKKDGARILTTLDYPFKWSHVYKSFYGRQKPWVSETWNKFRYTGEQLNQEDSDICMAIFRAHK